LILGTFVKRYYIPFE
jgi:hypothetical protein